MALLKRLNPTAQILRARSFCRHHEYIFALLCLLNVNMGALDLSQRAEVDEDTGDAYTLYEGHHAHTLLHELATVYASMDATIQVIPHTILAALCLSLLPPVSNQWHIPSLLTITPRVWSGVVLYCTGAGAEARHVLRRPAHLPRHAVLRRRHVHPQRRRGGATRLRPPVRAVRALFLSH